MKLATYNPVVNKNSINGVQVRAYDDGSAAYMRQSAAQTETAGRIAASIGQMQGQTLKGIANTIQNVGEQIDAVNVQAASNEYTKRLNDVLYNQDNGLMNTQMQGADGITQKFEEAERKIRQEVGKQYQFLSAKGSMVFNRMTDNSAAQRYEMVRRHQTQQFNAYKDVTYNNALELNTQTAADNYAMPEVVDQNMAEAIASVRMRYADQGEEVVKAQERKAVGGIAQQVINRAYAQGDTDSAEKYIEKYGRYMDASVVSGYAKNVYATKMAAMQEVTAKSLFAQFGDNEEAAYNYINSDAFGGNGNVNNALTWYKDAEARGESLGKNQCTVGLNKALVAGGYKPINTWAPTAWEEVKDTSRAFKDRSKLRPGDIVYWNTSSIPGEASHVGMYAGDGKVCQSGDSGIRTISLDAYTVVGFSRPEGKAATPEERKKLFAAYQGEVALRKRFEAQENQRIFDSVQQRLFDMQKNGVNDPGAYEAVIAQAVGGNAKLAAKLMPMAKSYAGVSAKASGAKQSSALDPMLEPTIVNMMTREGYSNQDIIEFVDKNKDNPNSPILFNDRGCAKVLDLMQDRVNGTGAFKYNWDGMEKAVMAGYRGNASMKDFAWSNVKAQTIYDIDDFRTRNHREPTRDEVIAMAREKLTGYSYTAPGFFGTTTKTIEQHELGGKGIYHISRNGNGMNDIVIKVGNQWVRRRISDADIEKIKAGEDVLNFTNENAYAR